MSDPTKIFRSAVKAILQLMYTDDLGREDTKAQRWHGINISDVGIRFWVTENKVESGSSTLKLVIEPTEKFSALAEENVRKTVEVVIAAFKNATKGTAKKQAIYCKGKVGDENAIYARLVELYGNL